jgi:hypothetical protein
MVTWICLNIAGLTPIGKQYQSIPIGQNASHSSRVDEHPKECKRKRERERFALTSKKGRNELNKKHCESYQRRKGNATLSIMIIHTHTESAFAPYVGFGVLMTSKLGTNMILMRYVAAISLMKELKS